MKRKQLLTLLKRYAPWFITALIFIYLFNRIDPGDFIASFRRLNPWGFFPVVLISGLSAFFIDVYINSRIFRDFGTDVRYREMLPARGVTFIWKAARGKEDAKEQENIQQ